MIRRFSIFLIVATAFVGSVHTQDKEGKSGPQPKLLSAPSPVYPAEAREAGIGGRVVARVVVDASGGVVSVDEPTGPPAQLCGSGGADRRVIALRDAVVEALKQAKFEPAMKDGKPVKSVIYLGLTFDPSSGSEPSGEKRMVKAGVINGTALRLPRPEYPSSARASRAAGAVSVQVVVDETGKVTTAEAVSGHALLRPASVMAACNAKFAPTILGGKAVQITGVITYNFVP